MLRAKHLENRSAIEIDFLDWPLAECADDNTQAPAVQEAILIVTVSAPHQCAG
jgi:hypothetical protein